MKQFNPIQSQRSARELDKLLRDIDAATRNFKAHTDEVVSRLEKNITRLEESVDDADRELRRFEQGKVVEMDNLILDAVREDA